MYGNHPDSKLTGSTNSTGNRIRDFMQLQVKEHTLTSTGEFTNNIRSSFCQQLKPNLVGRTGWPKLVNEGHGVFVAWVVECNDDG